MLKEKSAHPINTWLGALLNRKNFQFRAALADIYSTFYWQPMLV
jgi:hypothetical protein